MHMISIRVYFVDLHFRIVNPYPLQYQTKALFHVFVEYYPANIRAYNNILFRAIYAMPFFRYSMPHRHISFDRRTTIVLHLRPHGRRFKIGIYSSCIIPCGIFSLMPREPHQILQFFHIHPTADNSHNTSHPSITLISVFRKRSSEHSRRTRSSPESRIVSHSPLS